MKTSGKSIYTFDSGVSGPRLMILGGVHGNEMTGIRAVQELIASLSNGVRTIERGSIILALGNLRAIEKNMRGSVPHADMNRVFFRERLKDPSDYEEFRASELAPFMAASDILIDIHSTNKPSKPFAVAMDDNPARIALAGHFPTSEFLVSPSEIIDGTTDVWVTQNGGIGLGYESGLTTDVTKVPETVSSIEKVMSAIGMTEPGLVETAKPLRISVLKEAVIMEDAFEFAEGRGEGSFEPFRAGDALGVVGGRTVRAGYDGLIMFPKIPEHRKEGSPVAFLASVMRE